MIQAKPNRNEPCYCGSGKKFKKCCLGKKNDSQSYNPTVNKVRDIGYELDRAKFCVNAGNLVEAMNICRNILNQTPNDIDALNLFAILLFYNGNLVAAINVLQKAVVICPNSIDAHNNLGEFYRTSGDFNNAIKHFQKVLLLRPDNVNSLINCGNALQDIYKYNESINFYLKALSLDPFHLGALSNLGNLYQELARHEDAIAVFKQIVSKNEDYDCALGGLQFSKLHCCDWSDYEDTVSKIRVKVKQGLNVIKPFELLAISDSPEDQYLCAETFVKAHLTKPKNSNPRDLGGEKKKIRVAYFSADFHDHATMHLMAELFEHHNKDEFEWIAFSFGPDSEDKWRARILPNFSKFIDVKFKSDNEVVEIARDMALDIAIDLKGYTTNSRPQIFYQRVAPLQVSFLGYPGTTGGDFIDYMIADKTLVTQKERKFYSEKIIYMPDSYQVNDSSSNADLAKLSREDFGLPENGFVFCCFNNPYKITPAIFDSWMKLLKGLEGSVIWLYGSNGLARQNLKKEAIARGVDPTRLIFAEHLERDQHLSRIALADLFLDTLPYNAHTTASDALRVGLPIVTIKGDSFAGRVAASLLESVGLSDLVATSIEEYEFHALELAKNPANLYKVKATLLNNLKSFPLFDSLKYTKGFESALRRIHGKYRDGLPSDDLMI